MGKFSIGLSVTWKTKHIEYNFESDNYLNTDIFLNSSNHPTAIWETTPPIIQHYFHFYMAHSLHVV